MGSKKIFYPKLSFPRKSSNGPIDSGKLISGSKEPSRCLRCGSKSFVETVSAEGCTSCGWCSVDYWDGLQSKQVVLKVKIESINRNGVSIISSNQFKGLNYEVEGATCFCSQGTTDLTLDEEDGNPAELPDPFDTVVHCTLDSSHTFLYGELVPGPQPGPGDKRESSPGSQINITFGRPPNQASVTLYENEAKGLSDAELIEKVKNLIDWKAMSTEI